MLDSLLFATKQRPYVLFLLLTILIWLNSFHSGTINLDTPWLVENNIILQEASLDSLGKIFFDFSIGTRLSLGAEYLPIRDLSVMLDFLFFGESWVFHHFHSLFWYLLAGFFLLKLAFHILGENTLTWLGVFSFMVHPTHVESVVWLASRKDLLSLALGFWGLLSYVKNQRIFAPTVLFLLAYWAKNTAIIFPPLLVCYTLLIARESPYSFSWWRKWSGLVIGFSAGLFLTMRTGKMVAMFAERRGENLLEGISIASQSWLQYAQMLLFPDSLSLLYSEPIANISTAAFLGFGLVSLGIFLLGYCLMAKHFRASFFLLWMGISFLPISQITPIQNLIADRYLLLPSAGFCLLISIPRYQRLQEKLLLSWAILLSFFTIQRIPLFHSSLSIWLDVTEKQPQVSRGWTSTIFLLQEMGDTEAAKNQLTKAFYQLPNHPALLQSQGNLALSAGDQELALESFSSAWSRDKELRKSANNLVVLYQQQGNFSKAIEIARELTTIHPLYANGWNTLGAAGIGSRDLTLAADALEKAYSLEPYSTSILSNLGDLHYLQQDYSKAQYFWLQTLQLAPNHEHAQQGLNAIQDK